MTYLQGLNDLYMRLMTYIVDQNVSRYQPILVAVFFEYSLFAILHLPSQDGWGMPSNCV